MLNRPNNPRKTQKHAFSGGLLARFLFKGARFDSYVPYFFKKNLQVCSLFSTRKEFKHSNTIPIDACPSGLHTLLCSRGLRFNPYICTIIFHFLGFFYPLVL
jgi:hypothetical protein